MAKIKAQNDKVQEIKEQMLAGKKIVKSTLYFRDQSTFTKVSTNTSLTEE